MNRINYSVMGILTIFYVLIAQHFSQPGLVSTLYAGPDYHARIIFILCYFFNIGSYACLTMGVIETHLKEIVPCILIRSHSIYPIFTIFLKQIIQFVVVMETLKVLTFCLYLKLTVPVLPSLVPLIKPYILNCLFLCFILVIQALLELLLDSPKALIAILLSVSCSVLVSDILNFLAPGSWVNALLPLNLTLTNRFNHFSQSLPYPTLLSLIIMSGVMFCSIGLMLHLFKTKNWI